MDELAIDATTSNATTATHTVPVQNFKQPPHRIFENADVVFIVISLLYSKSSPDGDQTTQSDLVSAALTCKAFFGPATESLWRNLDSFLPLLKVLPTFGAIDEVYKINGMVTPEQWKRLTSYGSKVRKLCLASHREVITGHVIHHLSNLDPPLFPNLQEVEVDFEESTSNLDDIFLTASKSLDTLSISCISLTKADTVAAYLSVLDEKKSPLRSICLNGHLTHYTLSMINRFSMLTSVEIRMNGGTLDLSVFKSWESLSYLKNLTIEFDSAPSFDIHDQRALENTAGKHLVNFQDLEQLFLFGQLVDFLQLLRSMQLSKTLELITLDFEPDMNSVISQPKLLLECLKECLRVSGALRDLRLVLYRPSPEEFQFVLPGETVLLLSRCRQLQRLDISDDMHLAYNDNTIHMMCSNNNWSNVTNLVLPCATQDKSPSIHSLTILAKYCPNLVELSICIDFRLHTYESLLAERSGPRMLHKLTVLKIFKLPTETAVEIDMKMTIAMSRFFEYHFPNLETMSSHLRSTYSSENAWFETFLALIDEYRVLRIEAQSEVLAVSA